MLSFIKKYFFMLIIMLNISSALFSTSTHYQTLLIKDNPINQEMQEFLGFSLYEYEPDAQEVIKKFWSQIKQSNLFNLEKPNDSLYRVHRLITPSGLKILFDLAIQTKTFIKNINPEGPYNIYSLGQSSAWLIEMMKAIDITKALKQKKQILDAHYDYIAFSGSWYDKSIDGTKTLQIDSTMIPSTKNKAAYSKYLNQLQFPKSFLTEKNFVIEFPQSGKGLQSFLDITRDFFKRNFTLLMGPHDSNLIEIGYSLSFISKKINLEFLVPMANSDNFDDRLVMSYKPWEWETKTPLTFKPSRSAELLRQIIYAYVDKKFKNSSPTYD